MSFPPRRGWGAGRASEEGTEEWCPLSELQAVAQRSRLDRLDLVEQRTPRDQKAHAREIPSVHCAV